MNSDDLRNVLTQSDSVWNLREALKRAIEIIEAQDTQIDNLIEEIELIEVDR